MADVGRATGKSHNTVKKYHRLGELKFEKRFNQWIVPVEVFKAYVAGTLTDPRWHDPQPQRTKLAMVWIAPAARRSQQK